jgi:hypothetical protein
MAQRPAGLRAIRLYERLAQCAATMLSGVACSSGGQQADQPRQRINHVSNAGTPVNNATVAAQLSKGVPNIFPYSGPRSMYSPLHHIKFGYSKSYYDVERAGVKVFAEKYVKKRFCVVTRNRLWPRCDGRCKRSKAMNMQRFVLRRLSYAYRRPKLFTIAEWQLSSALLVQADTA